MISDNCQVLDSKETGSGLFAKKDFKKGETVYVCQIEQTDCQNGSHPSQVDMNKWVLFSFLGRSINHSCDPSCGIGFSQGKWSYKAFKDIKSGDELTYDYGMANYIVSSIHQCKCGSQKCRGEIKGFQNLPEDLKRKYKGYFAPYLEKLVGQKQLERSSV